MCWGGTVSYTLHFLLGIYGEPGEPEDTLYKEPHGPQVRRFDTMSRGFILCIKFVFLGTHKAPWKVQ